MGAGVIAMTTLFTSLFGGIVLLFDKNWGLMREILASPLPRNHIIVGIGLSGMTKSFIQAIIIMLFGLLIGVEFFKGFSTFQIVISHPRDTPLCGGLLTWISLLLSGDLDLHGDA